MDAKSRSASFFPLAVGNYWIYDNSRFNTVTYVGIPSDILDTIEITGVKTIRDQLYYEMVKSRFTQSQFGGKDTLYLRDSSGYIVNSLGEIEFTLEDFDTPFKTERYSGYEVEFSIKDSMSTLITPAGVYGCFDMKGKISKNNETFPGKYFHRCYTENVGLVYESKFLLISPSSPGITEYRRALVEYKVE